LINQDPPGTFRQPQGRPTTSPGPRTVPVRSSQEPPRLQKLQPQSNHQPSTILPTLICLDSLRQTCLPKPMPIGWRAEHGSARNGIPSRNTGCRLEYPLLLGCLVTWLFNQPPTILICQRTPSPSLHSTLEPRHSRFPRALPLPATCVSAGFRTGHLSSAARSRLDLSPVPSINHQPSTINQEPVKSFSFPCPNPRTKAPPASTSLCMICMIRKKTCQ
jgi:hypothetical protein